MAMKIETKVSITRWVMYWSSWQTGGCRDIVGTCETPYGIVAIHGWYVRDVDRWRCRAHFVWQGTRISMFCQRCKPWTKLGLAWMVKRAVCEYVQAMAEVAT